MSDNEKKQDVEVYVPKTALAKAREEAQAPQGQTSADAVAVVLAAREKALVEARYVVALKQPRDLDDVRVRLLKECKRPSFARVAVYHKPIGKGIEGPSIRFAEAAIQAMGNITIDTPTIFDDVEKRIMRVTVSDVEGNVSYSQDVTIQKTVERHKPKDGDEVLSSRQNSYGKTVYRLAATDDDVLNKQNALISKAVRTLGLRLVPGWLIDECLLAVRQTAADEDAKDPDATKRRIFDSFAALGVPADEVTEYVGHSLDTLTKEERQTLFGLYNAIKDGEASWAEVMESRREAKAKAKPSEGPAQTTGLKDALAAKAGKGPEKVAAEPASEKPTPTSTTPK